MTDWNYQSGFRNYFETEALPGALPKGQNSPKIAPLGLIPEQLSGTAFTMPRKDNYRTWLYRILPSVVQGGYRSVPAKAWVSPFAAKKVITPEPMRWDPLPQGEGDWIDSLMTLAANGDPISGAGSSVLLYHSSQTSERVLQNSDGDMLFVPYLGKHFFTTELGRLEIAPGQIALIPRGIKFLLDHPGEVAGYILENFGAPFELPNLGPIGANGLANPRDFETPVAYFEDESKSVTCLTRFGGELFEQTLESSPFNVVAWHGNYAPFRYDLAHFNTIGTVSFDHPDPSIFTVLTSPTTEVGKANVDFVIFPPRWMVAEGTFRPPYFHKNYMSELMGLIKGTYDAKLGGGFVPGGASLHNRMSAHGPDGETLKAGCSASDAPEYYKDTMAFMFESSALYVPTHQAYEHSCRQKDYLNCWKDIQKSFTL